MSTDINSYRLTDLEEPPLEMLSQIMREAAQDAAAQYQESLTAFFAIISAQTSEIHGHTSKK